jgi:UDP-glucose 4-epimerase
VVAVTGASGFVGRALVAALLARGATVRGLSRAPWVPASPRRADRSAPASVRAAGTEAPTAWVRGDLRDRDALARLVDGAELVLHAAGWVHRRPRASELAEVRAVNVGGTAALCDAAGDRPLVFVSSTAVYGDAPGPWDEDTPCRPTTAYGRTKLEAEALVLAGPRRAVVRPSAIVGDGAPGNLRLLDRVARLGVVPVLGAARKSFTHVSTVVATVLAVAERLADGVPVDRIVVATDDEPVTVAELVRARGARPIRVPAALARWIPADRLAAVAGDAVASNRRMRALGVVPDPTARDWLAR